ncbi:MAG: signal peptidase I [Actinobacteria bacterium]|nr:signal peptidase I [Actinomycetota bacterium]
MSSSVEPDETHQDDAPHQPIGKLLRDWLVVIFVALSAALLVRMYVLQQYYISGPSMESTLFENDRVLVNKLSYRLHDIRHGDVIVFDRVTSNGANVAHDDLIKRVIGLSGDKVEIKSCVVYVNGAALKEPYLDKGNLSQVILEDRCRQPNMASVAVTAGQIFVMGDNRPESFDSRSFGTISESLVVGRAFIVVWPFDSWKLL